MLQMLAILNNLFNKFFYNSTFLLCFRKWKKKKKKTEIKGYSKHIMNLSKNFFMGRYLMIIQKPKRTRFTIQKVNNSLIVDL